MRVLFMFLLLSIVSCSPAFAQSNDKTAAPAASHPATDQQATAAPTVASEPAANQQATAAVLAAQEKQQLSAIGNLSFSLTSSTGENVSYAFDGSKSTAPESLFLQLTNPPQGLIANYRFQGQKSFLPLAKDGKSDKVSIPSNVDMIEVQLTWCNGSCPAQTGTGPAPYTCPPTQSSAATGNAKTPSPDALSTRDNAR